MMYVAGLDIGTTSLCCVIADAETGDKIKVAERPNDASFPSLYGWDRTQNADRIHAIIEELIQEMAEYWSDVRSIGVSCQMHGVLYIDGQGNAISPLYTWQDRRGDCPYNDSMTYVAYMRRCTEYELASGYGMVTHFYHVHNGQVPVNSTYICTIGDYVSMKLCGLTRPTIDASNAASLGLFDLNLRQFNKTRMEELGINPSIVPPVAGVNAIVGMTADGKAVACAIGDNQASFLGSVPALESSILINVGTGSQISVYAGKVEPLSGMEWRPFPDGGYLGVGASLGGGKSYALLEALFKEVCELFTDSAPVEVPLYERMNALAERALIEEGSLLQVSSHFFGTRNNTELKGSVTGITGNNFTARQLIVGFLDGMADELIAFIDEIPEGMRNRMTTIVASGNGVRRNQVLQQLLHAKLGQPIHLPVIEEEAAIGAALHASVCCGIFVDYHAAMSRFRRSESIHA